MKFHFHLQSNWMEMKKQKLLNRIWLFSLFGGYSCEKVDFDSKIIFCMHLAFFSSICLMDVDSIVSFESFRAPKLSLFENCRAVKF